MTATALIDPMQVPPDEYTVAVTATDMVGHSQAVRWRLVIDRDDSCDASCLAATDGADPALQSALSGGECPSTGCPDLRTPNGAISNSQNGICAGWFQRTLSPANIHFNRLSDGRLEWHFRIKYDSWPLLGISSWYDPVAVSMPPWGAAVNGNFINPPYTVHNLPKHQAWYDFHGSMRTYQKIGGGSGTLAKNDVLSLVWWVDGPPHVDSNGDEYRIRAFSALACKVPAAPTGKRLPLNTPPANPFDSTYNRIP